MSPSHILAADITGLQMSSCPQSLINLATRLNEGRESEKTNFNLPHKNLAWPVFKGWWWPLSIFREKQYTGGSKCVLSPQQPLALS